MNKTELTAVVAEKAGLTKKDAKNAVDAIFEAMQEAIVAGNGVQVIGFGNFYVAERSARVGLNPQTKQKIEIPASKAVKFKAGAALKAAVK